MLNKSLNVRFHFLIHVAQFMTLIKTKTEDKNSYFRDVTTTGK